MEFAVTGWKLKQRFQYLSLYLYLLVANIDMNILYINISCRYQLMIYARLFNVIGRAAVEIFENVFFEAAADFLFFVFKWHTSRGA